MFACAEDGPKRTRTQPRPCAWCLGALAGNHAAARPAVLVFFPRQVGPVEMRDYQLYGLRWLAMMHSNGMNAILADEMGLGKTLQTIAFLAHLKFDLGIAGPHLVVCPLSVLSSWMSELKRFCPQLRAVKLHSADMEERKRLINTISNSPGEFDVVRALSGVARQTRCSPLLGAAWKWAPASAPACVCTVSRPAAQQVVTTFEMAPTTRLPHYYTTNYYTTNYYPAQVVTTFEMAKAPNVHSVLAHRTWWRYLVVDEGHALKNDA